MSRQEFTKAIKLAAFERSGGRCGQCTVKLSPGHIEYHHGAECAFGGVADLDNCVALCRACHRRITSDRAPVIAKSTRIRNRHIGIRRSPSRPMPGTKASGLRKRMDGTVERR